MTWHILSTIHHGFQLTELLAAACDDGIGIIARWTLREDGKWDVEAMDTESTDGMQPVTEFSEEEPVPATPPTLPPTTRRKTFADLKEETPPPVIECPECKAAGRPADRSYALPEPVGKRRCMICRTEFWPSS